MADIRNVGTAIEAWLLDYADSTPASAPIAPPAAAATVAWSACPPISHRELSRLLVPVYIQKLPRRDGWRRPLEFCLDRTGGHGHARGVRSAGADGAFEGAAYRAGPFPAAEMARDLVWLDGDFVTWPEP
jgi:hypothetical protein